MESLGTLNRIKKIVLVGHDNEGSSRMFDKIVDGFPGIEFLMVITRGLYYRKTVLSSILKILREASWCFAAVRCLELFVHRLNGETLEKKCRQRGIRRVYSTDVNSPGFARLLEEFGPDLLVSLYTMQIYNGTTLKIARHGSIQIHPSLLPEYRGLEVLFWMLANGEREGGVSVFFLREKVDAGPVIEQEIVSIPPEMTVSGLYQKTSEIGGELLIRAIRKIDRGEVKPIEPKGEGSYYRMPDRSAYKRFRGSGRKFF